MLSAGPRGGTRSRFSRGTRFLLTLGISGRTLPFDPVEAIVGKSGLIDSPPPMGRLRDAADRWIWLDREP
jgi:hypothetical protein